MAARVELTTRLDAEPDKVWHHVLTPRPLDHVASPMVKFRYVTPINRSATWPSGKHIVRMQLFGLIPLGRQVIDIEYPPHEGDVRKVRDNGYGPMVRRWDHQIAIAPHPAGGARYTDRVEIDAGLFTPVVAAFARQFYAHRQRRWRSLARGGFVALAR